MSCYVALDGPDGCGKSAQAEALVQWLQAAGRDVLHVREPGSTPVGEALRQLLLSPATGELQPISEALLFAAARAELVAGKVAPALRGGAIVVSERCYLSTVVYQGLAVASGPGNALPADWLFDLARRVHGSVVPDQVLVLDVPFEVSLARRRSRAEDRIEGRGRDYHERVRRGYLEAAARDGRAAVLDASRAFEVVQQDLRVAVSRWLR